MAYRRRSRGRNEKIWKKIKEGRKIKRQKVKITRNKEFNRDLKEVYKSLSEIKKGSYRIFKKKLNIQLERLKLFPYMYQKVENELEFRRFFIQNYVIIYKIDKNYILLFRVLPSKSNYIQKEIYKKQFPKNKVIK